MWQVEDWDKHYRDFKCSLNPKQQPSTGGEIAGKVTDFAKFQSWGSLIAENVSLNLIVSIKSWISTCEREAGELRKREISPGL